MSQSLKVAVVGHLGKWHADKYAAAFSDYRDIISLVDAVSLVVPTSLYYKIAREFLEAGIHCLVEKVFADTAQPDLSITETTASRCLSFSIFPEITEAVCAATLGTR
jgi:predicted dehydrogenase